MPTIKIPTPLRTYTGGNAEIEVSGNTVAAILEDLVAQYPDLKQHLFHEGQLRDFVNVFIGEDDIRERDGINTIVQATDRLRIIPSIAGGTDEGILSQVDHSAIRTNQTAIITLLLFAFIVQLPLLVGFVSLTLFIGTMNERLNLFKLLYQSVLRPRGIIKPDIKPDNPEPHRFSQGLGATFTALSTLFLIIKLSVIGWGLAWLVIVLAGLNLFTGFCAGCFVYYQLSKHNVRGFNKRPIRI